MRIFIDAYGDIALICVKKLLQHHPKNSLQILVKTYDLPGNKNFLQFIRKNKIDYMVSIYRSDEIQRINGFNPDFVLSLFARDLIPAEIIVNVKYSMNLHPSLLPKYRGCFSVPWAIINGEDSTGISFHEISENFDEGKIIFQQRCKIYSDDTAQSLYSRLNFLFCYNFLTVFQRYVNGQISPVDQPRNEGNYYARRIPYGGLIDPSWDVEQIDRVERALFYPPFEPAVCQDRELIWDTILTDE